MSLSELTRNSFQSGISASKWASLCKLLVSKIHSQTSPQDIETDINSVIVLFRSYPGDPALQGYLKYAIQNGLLSLSTFVATFLAAARSPDLHNPATLDILCRVALDAHYASGTQAIGSLVTYSEPVTAVLAVVQDSMALLRVAHTLPASHFHQLTTSASELLILLMSCVTDLSQIPTAQALLHFADASDLLQMRLSHGVREVLENFALSLSLVLGDDVKAAGEAQLVHSMQLALGKGDILGRSSDSDVVTCSLVLHSLLFRRAHDYGSGDGPHVVAVLMSLLRWSTWTPPVFFSQLLLSAITCLAQSMSSGATKSAMLWRAFILGRLPHLLLAFQQAVVKDGAVDVDWRTALQIAFSEVLRHKDLLERCEQPVTSEASSNKSVSMRSFSQEFTQSLVSGGLVEATFAATMAPTWSNDHNSRLQSEAQDAGLELSAYFDTKLSTDGSLDDTLVFVSRVCNDPHSHATFAEIMRKRFSSLAKTHDVEGLSYLCKTLIGNEPALDVLSIHIQTSELVGHALTVVNEYDCEAVGDPQTAVSHLGDVVLFLQTTAVRYNLSCRTLNVGEKLRDSDLLSTATARRIDELQGEDASAFQIWFKALFDSNSEGIEDAILRSTRPKTLLRIAPTLFSQAIVTRYDRKMDKDVLNNGVIKTLLAEVQRFTEVQRSTEVQRFSPVVHFEVLQTLITSSSCPEPVLRLCAAAILRVFPTTKPIKGKDSTFDPSPLHEKALQTLGISGQEIRPANAQPALSLNEPCQRLIKDTLSFAHSGKAPSLDVDYCLTVTSPIKFLQILWGELLIAANLGQREASRRLATFVLTTPHSPRSPPLLPIFLHVVAPTLIAASDNTSSQDQAVALELLVAVISSALTAALNLEWALLAACGERTIVLGQPAAIMARRLAADLRRKGYGSMSKHILQRLASSAQFAANFPMFMTDL